MKNILLTSAALLALIFVSCENDIVEDLALENEQPTNQLSQDASAWYTQFYDGFDAGSNIDDRWIRTDGRTDYNSNICHYKDWNVELANFDGAECVRLQAYNAGNGEFHSGHMKTKNWASFTPGDNEEIHVKSRIKLVAYDGNYRSFNDTHGVWPAFWTVQETAWPTSGEIDIMEGYSHGNDPNKSSEFASNLFYGTQAATPGNNTNLLGNDAHRVFYGFNSDSNNGWHEYDMYWRRTGNYVSVRVVIDGVQRAYYDNSLVNNLNLNNFNTHSVILNLNVGSNDGIFQGTPNVFWNTYMYADYVLVEKRYL